MQNLKNDTERTKSKVKNKHYDRGMTSFPLYERLIYAIVMAILWVFTKLMWRWSIEDSHKMKTPSDKGRVIICNHTSMAEVPVIVTYMWSIGRRIRPIYKSEFNKNPIVAWAFTLAGGIPIERGSADMSALRYAQHALQRGEDVLIFPEGTRVRSDDQPAEVHGGFALMAQMAKTDILPIAVCGFRDITPQGKKLMRPVTCWIKAGDSVSLDDASKDLKRSERQLWAEEEALNRMFSLRNDLRNAHPGRR